MSGNIQDRLIEVEFDEYIEIHGILMFSHRYKVKLNRDEKEEYDKIIAEIESTHASKEDSQKALNDFENEYKDKNISIFGVPQLKEKWHHLIETNIRNYAEHISANSKLNRFKFGFKYSQLND